MKTASNPIRKKKFEPMEPIWPGAWLREPEMEMEERMGSSICMSEAMEEAGESTTPWNP
jgi:hypothetical protein